MKAFAADPQALFSSKRWFIAPDEGKVFPAGSPVLPALLRVVSAREQGDAVVATVQDVADRNAAEALAGTRIFVSRQSFPTPTADEFYWVDLIGLEVINREGLQLGRVAGLIETGPHCVLRLAPPASGEPDLQERLIPFVNAYVDAVDLAARIITVDWQPDF